MDQEVGAVAAEVRAVEVVQVPARAAVALRRRAGPGSRRARHHLAETVQVELADEAGEVGGLEELSRRPVAARARPRAAQQLGLEQRLVDQQPLAAGVPADGAEPRAVHQPPQLGGEVVGVDGGGQQRLLHGRGTGRPLSTERPPREGRRRAAPERPERRPTRGPAAISGPSAPRPLSGLLGTSPSSRAPAAPSVPLVLQSPPHTAAVPSASPGPTRPRCLLGASQHLPVRPQYRHPLCPLNPAVLSSLPLTPSRSPQVLFSLSGGSVRDVSSGGAPGQAEEAACLLSAPQGREKPRGFLLQKGEESGLRWDRER